MFGGWPWVVLMIIRLSIREAYLRKGLAQKALKLDAESKVSLEEATRTVGRLICPLTAPVL